MSYYSYAIVIDKNGDKIKFVLAEDRNKPLHYKMKDGEHLVFDNISIALSMIKPRWNGKVWEETATSEEIESSKPLEPQNIKESVSDLEIAFAEYVIETEQRLTELEEKINA